MQLLLPRKISLPRQFVYSAVVIALVSLVCFGLSKFMGYRMVAYILLLTVSLLATLFDILPVLFSAVLSAFIWDFFFIPPRFTFHVDTTEDLVLLIMYFAIALINGALTFQIRMAEKATRIKEERANSVKLYNTVLNSLSHELRTPISAIIAAADNLQSNDNLSQATKTDLIQEISKAGLRLNQQVENLLNISRLESGHIKPRQDWCDIIELVYETVKQVEENNPGAKIHVHVQTPAIFALTDRGMLQQIIYNLLNNACIHTPPKTRIDITIHCYADLLEIIVEDMGPGFVSVNPKEIFEKFAREGKTNGVRSGLGLSIVKGFTEALKGNVTLDKTGSDGVKFSLSFPVITKNFSELHE